MIPEKVIWSGRALLWIIGEILAALPKSVPL
jgi:hypothetical protein